MLKIAGHDELMENYPDGIASIQMRERIVLPLLTIQQYALLKISELNKAENPDLPVVVRGDGETQYKNVIDVLALLGRLDITQLGLVTQRLVQ